MKKNIIYSIIILSMFVSCASGKINDSEQDVYFDENYTSEEISNSFQINNDQFIGDFEPIQIDSFMFLQKVGKLLKPKEIKNAYLVPRTNSVELNYRDNVNNIIIIFNKTERDKIIDVCNLFLKQYEEKEVPHHKVNSKTAYLKSKISLWYGVLNAENGCQNNDYFVNCEFIDKKPYLLINFIPSRTDKGDSFTPKVSLYMSPTQVRAFINQMDQETLNAYVQDLNEKAYTY